MLVHDYPSVRTATLLLPLYALLHGMPSAFVLSSNRQSPQLLRVDPRFNRSRICPGRGSCRYLSRNKLNTARVIVRMAHTVFVYGTLLSEEIVKILLRRNPDSYAGEAYSDQLGAPFLLT